jgi:hypothetical protein
MSEFNEDPSASTARFRAFADRPEADNPAFWERRAPASRTLWLVVAVIAFALLVASIAMAIA